MPLPGFWLDFVLVVRVTVREPRDVIRVVFVGVKLVPEARMFGVPRRRRGHPICLLWIALLWFPAPDAFAEDEGRKLSSFKAGYYYASTWKEDGVLQLSDCRRLKGRPPALPGRDATCFRDGAGFRCTRDSSLDVVFVFRDKKVCEADRKKTLNSDAD